MERGGGVFRWMRDGEFRSVVCADGVVAVSGYETDGVGAALTGYAAHNKTALQSSVHTAQWQQGQAGAPRQTQAAIQNQPKCAQRLCGACGIRTSAPASAAAAPPAASGRAALRPAAADAFEAIVVEVIFDLFGGVTHWGCSTVVGLQTNCCSSFSPCLLVSNIGACMIDKPILFNESER